MKTLIKIMPCLDMQNGRVVKGIKFVDIKDAGDPVQSAQAYCAAGADELAMLDRLEALEPWGISTRQSRLGQPSCWQLQFFISTLFRYAISGRF